VRLPDGIVHDSGARAPATHVLVVGVGRYPHLIGGDAPCQNPDGMGQLSSPAVSARAVAEWFISEFHDPAAPLGTVALLLSEHQPTPFTNPRTGLDHAVELADTGHVADAIKAWKARADGSADNRTVFYFCGHGTSEGDDMALLMSDFCSDDANALNGAIDFRKLSGGMKKCEAVRQVYVIDACRSNSDQLIGDSDGFAGQVPLKPGGRPKEWAARLDVTYFATLSGEKAFARPGHVSLFTEALLKGLRGAASDDAEGDWRVNTARLQEAVAHFMTQELFAGEVAGIQVPVAGNLPLFELHRLKGDPTVPVYVGCQPSADNGAADLTCSRDGNVLRQRAVGDVDRDHPEREWVLDLAFGRYEFEAHLPAAPVRRKAIDVRPTYRRVILEETP
jgi:Caspase domain